MAQKASGAPCYVSLYGRDIRREADLLLREFPDSSVAYLRKAILERAEVFNGDGAAGKSLVAELTQRLAAGKRFWS